MDKDKKSFSKILVPKDYVYLTIIFIMIAILGFNEAKILVVGVPLFIIMLLISFYMNKIRKEEVERYIENLTFNIDSANKSTLASFPLPMVTVELSGMIIWHNELFRDMLNKDGLIERYIYEFLEDLKPDQLIQDDKIVPSDIIIDNRNYVVMGNLVKMNDKNIKDYLAMTLYFIDNTEYNNLLKRYIDERPIVGIAIIDNYDELMQSIADDGRSQLLAEIDKAVKGWFEFTDGMVRKYERDKYVMFFESKYLKQMEDEKFELLDLVKNIEIGNTLPVTLSIGLAKDAVTIADNMKDALNAIELALGRGGDQVVINRNNEYTFFGGKSKEMEKRTRVKARVMANALEKLVEQSKNVLIMGHSNPDADSVGAAVGIYRAIQCLNREANIVIEPNITVKEIMNRLEISGQYEGVFLRHNEALDKISQDTLLIIVDTHRASFTELPDLLKFTKKIVVIDHHRKVTDFISEAMLTYHEIYASSASELVAELLQYMDKKVVIRQIEAEALYAGIIVDTKNFTFKTGIRTFEAAAFLKKYGVDTISVKQMFQNDIDTYIAKAEVIKNAEVIDKDIAISICGKNVENSQVVVAQSADDLLNIIGIKASFVLCESDKQIIISGRSLGDINVQMILEKLGGGGSMTIAGAQVPDVTVEEAKSKLIEAIQAYKEQRTDS